MTRVIAHISDLHFGRHDPAIAEALIAELAAQAPNLVAVSGDLTQRARRAEFAAARAFLDRIAAPVIAVPGNHDVPLYNLARRMLRPMIRFRRYISAEPMPVFTDEELAVAGINTARVTAFSNGRISRLQVERLRDFFAASGAGLFRVIVTHHPLTRPPAATSHRVVHRAAFALDGIAEAGIDLILTGHYHQATSDEIAAHRVAVPRSILVSQAGTAISTRRRAELNSYNLIHIAEQSVTCSARSWTEGGFVTTESRRYAQSGGRWIRLD